MHNIILRILLGAILVSFVSTIVVSIIGSRQGWTTSTQFSDGFFWAGAIMGIIGFITLQGYRQRSTEWPPLNLDPAERGRLWAADVFHGQMLAAVFGAAAVLLFGASFLVLRLF